MRISERADRLFGEQQERLHRQTDQLFCVLMVVQWVAAIAMSLWLSPLTWDGAESRVHIHVWAALFLGGLLSIFPILLGVLLPGRAITRYVIAVAQMLMSGLLVQITGGRIETHFHVFGSLAFLACYRDWRVLVPATIAVTSDHFVRGVFWPESIYGVLAVGGWRWLEHAGWVLFENAVLVVACVRGSREMRLIAEHTARIETSEERYRAFIEQSHDRIWRLELEQPVLISLPEEEQLQALCRYGYVAESNDALARSYGFNSAAGMVGTHLSDLTAHPDSRHLELLRSLIQSEYRLEKVEINGLGPEGRPICFLHTLVGVVEHGRLIRAWGTEQDISERRQLEERLRQAQKMEAVGSLAGGVAHDFNNMLAVINGYTELALSQLAPSHHLAMPLGEVRRAGERAADLTRQLLAYSRKQILEPQLLDLNEVVNRMDAMLRRLIGEDIDFVTRLAPAPMHAKADPGQMEQVLMNLAVNARDAMPQGGTLTISLQEIKLDQSYDRKHVPVSGEYVMLSVSDTGVGMDEATAIRIFEPFYTTKGLGRGTGLGLSTVYGIVTQSDGGIDVHSAPGEGATFNVYLPKVVATHRAAPRACLENPCYSQSIMQAIRTKAR